MGTSVCALPIFQLGSLNQTVQGKIADLIADPCDGVSIFRNADIQRAVLREHGNAVPCGRIPHILQVTFQAIDFLSSRLRIHKRQGGLIHGGIDGCLPLHGISRTYKIYYYGSDKYKKKNCPVSHNFFHSMIKSLLGLFFHLKYTSMLHVPFYIISGKTTT